MDELFHNELNSVSSIGLIFKRRKLRHREAR